MRSRTKLVIGVALAAFACAGIWLKWQQGQPRRECLATIGHLKDALASTASDAFSTVLILPTALQNRTQAEQNEFIRKALIDELSSEGLAVLKREGLFGPLQDLFPAEADAWASQAGVHASNCVAFRLDRTNGSRAEVVLVRPSSILDPPSLPGSGYRIIRLNNVNQLTQISASPTNSSK